MESYNINGINITFTNDKSELKKQFEDMLQEGKNKIAFMNPEYFMNQEKDFVLHNYFATNKFNFVDGMGLIYAVNHVMNTKYDSSYRVPGTDFLEYLPENRDVKIFLYGGIEENVVVAKEKIEEKFSNVQICGYINGYTDEDEESVVNKINESNADILIVCIGCPKQELWINRHYNELNVKIVFGNGGAIDFWSESVKRAPSYIIKLGLEFMYRLFQDFTFKRIKRTLNLCNFYLKYKTKRYRIKRI